MEHVVVVATPDIGPNVARVDANRFAEVTDGIAIVFASVLRLPFLPSSVPV